MNVDPTGSARTDEPNEGSSRPKVYGYIRDTPKSGSLREQQRIVQEWFWKDCVGEYQWGGWCRDKQPRGKSPKEKKQLFILHRPKLDGLLCRIGEGDMLIVPWLGVLCENLDDAIEGLPSILGRGIRVQLALDRMVLTEGHLDLIRALRRDWYADNSTRVPAPMGCRVRPHSDKNSPHAKFVRRSWSELRFMKFCYRKHIYDGIPYEHMLNWAVGQWPRHPRLGTALRTDQIINAVESYQDVLVHIRLGRKIPSWVREAQTKGYFTETQDEMAMSRAAHLYRFAKAVKK